MRMRWIEARDSQHHTHMWGSLHRHGGVINGCRTPLWPITFLPTKSSRVAVSTPRLIQYSHRRRRPPHRLPSALFPPRPDSDPFFLPVMEKSRPFPECSAPYVGFGCEDGASTYSFNGPTGKEGGFSSSADPELKRKKRIAAYNSFVAENKLKSSVRSSVKWIKSKFADVRYG